MPEKPLSLEITTLNPGIETQMLYGIRDTERIKKPD
jgi:hypothetical protein